MNLAERPPRRAALAFVFVTVLLDMIALGVIAPVLPHLVIGMLHGQVARASLVYGLFATVFALMQFVCSPLLGVLSDRFGRRPVIILSNLGMGLNYVVMALAPNLAWLFVGRVVGGITSASATTASAYIADVTPPEKRAGAFGMLGAAFGLGFIVGPAIGGLLGALDPRVPFWAAAALSLANAAYGYVVLPESLRAEHRAAFGWNRAHPLGSLRLLRAHHGLFGLATVVFVSSLASTVLPTVFVLYTIARYGWDQRAIGLSLAFVGICTAIVSAVLTQPLVTRLGERRALVAGLLCGALGLAVYGLAPSGLAFTCGTPLLMLWTIGPTAAQTIMTRRVLPSEQGELQGAISSLRGLAMLIGPAPFALSFAAVTGPLAALRLPGAPWFVAAAMLLAVLVPAWRVAHVAAGPAAVPASAA